MAIPVGSKTAMPVPRSSAGYSSTRVEWIQVNATNLLNLNSIAQITRISDASEGIIFVSGVDSTAATSLRVNYTTGAVADAKFALLMGNFLAEARGMDVRE
jgi:hypothetical protein